MVLTVRPNEIAEIARCIVPMVNEFGLVVGGDAALQVAKKANFVGSVCRSLGDPAIAKAVGDRDGWAPGRGPSEISAWIDTEGVPPPRRDALGHRRGDDTRGVPACDGIRTDATVCAACDADAQNDLSGLCRVASCIV